MPDVTNVHLTPASPLDQATGLLAFASFRLGRLQVDGITVRRTRAGNLILSFPARRDRSGREHPYIRPLDDAARQQIETQVFKALGVSP